VGSRGKAPVGGLGDEVPQKLMHFFINKHEFLGVHEMPEQMSVVIYWNLICA